MDYKFKSFRILGFLVTVMMTSISTANFSGNRCSTHRTGPAPSVCEGRTIPASKARNLRVNTQMLNCSANVDHYIRRPQKFDFNTWATLVQNGKKQEAYNLRREQQKEIAWSGSVPFVTVETWVWESCDLITSSSECGTTTKTRIYDCSYTTSRSCDSKGRCTGGNRVSKTCTESYQDPNTCYADVSHRENWECSNEIMTYSAKFDRPKDWTPQTPGYKDPIPNKYDLLPGEVEDIQVLNNQSMASSVSPFTKVGDAWNEYKISNTINGSTKASCIQNGKYHANITIYTDKRIPSKKTPNAFRLPHDSKGNKILALSSDTVKLEDGKDFEIQSESKNSFIAGHPSAVYLDDTSSSMITLIAEQSRKNEEREVQKEKLSLGKNNDSAEALKKDPAFFKNTKVKIELLADNKYWWKTSSTDPIVVDDIDAVEMDFRSFSTNQDIASSDLWKIILNSKVKKNNNIYMVSDSSERTLRPDQKYLLKISMYQKGVKGFYKQDCEEDSEAWDCKWWSLFMKRNEKDYYSDPIEIYFKTPEKMQDERGFGRKVLDILDLF
ncbi:MAG: hypothetical protein HUU56_03570 [Bdellovibrionaceae bacterium]|nr:hypothetical protein [Pseudobdellovibrionaceae bacterium]